MRCEYLRLALGQAQNADKSCVVPNLSPPISTQKLPTPTSNTITYGHKFPHTPHIHTPYYYHYYSRNLLFVDPPLPVENFNPNPPLNLLFSHPLPPILQKEEIATPEPTANPHRSKD